MLLETKTAVVYGAGGAIGGAVARAFAREGATVFLAGRTPDTLETVARQITATGGNAEVAAVDALDERAVEEHAAAVVRQTGRIDISFNAIGVPQQGLQGTPVVDLAAENFSLPIRAYTTAQFLTARAAARRMIEQGAGAILAITAISARSAAPNIGGMGAAWAAMEAFARTLAAELGPRGVRVVTLRAHGLPETATVQQVLALHAASAGTTGDQIQSIWEAQTLLGRLPTLAEVADTAAFLASDRAGAMTATVANLTAGAAVD